MKLLAIRGAGLASLSEPFVVELWRGPLAHAGVFAIVGPTGAGKSTLLDAVFLALFGQPPRLGGLERVRVGASGDADGLTSRDARSLARGDALVAYAEVDFTGIDGGIYRARWETRRKRASASSDGEAWRRAEHALSRLASPGDETGQRIGGTKTEVLAHVEARLGLDLAQFRRSVVLAQGEIAAFLHAADRDRAELLERMTGTELYAAISRQLHEEASRRGVKVAVQREQSAAIVVLDPLARAGLERDVAQAQAVVQLRQKSAREAEARLARWQALEQMLAERLAAHLEHARHAAALADAGPQRARLAEEAAIAALAPLFAALAMAQAEVAERGARCIALEDARASAAARAAVHRGEVGAATTAAEQAAAALDEAARAEQAAEAALGRATPAAEEAASELRRHAVLKAEATEAAAQLERSSVAEGAARAALATWARLKSEHPGLEAALVGAPSGGTGTLEDGGTTDVLAARVLAIGAHIHEGQRAIERERRAESEAAAAKGRAERQCATASEAVLAVAKRRERAEARLTRAIDSVERVVPSTSDAPAPAETRAGRGASSGFLRGVRPTTDRAFAAGRAGVALSEGGLSLSLVPEAEPLVVGSIRSTEPRDVLLPADAPRGRSAAARRAGHASPTLSALDRAEACRRAAWGERSHLEHAAAAAEQRATEAARRRRERRDDRLLLARFASDLSRLAADVVQAEHDVRTAEETLSVAVRAGHAALLRERLAPGTPCEVCGATEHRVAPGIAEAHVDVEALQRALDEARAVHADLGGRHAALSATFPLLARLAADAAPVVDDPRPAIALQLHTLEEAVAALDAAMAELREALEVAARAEAQQGEASQRARDASIEQVRAVERAARAGDDLARAVRERTELGLDGLLAHVEAQTSDPTAARALLRSILHDGRIALREARRAEARIDLLQTALFDARRKSGAISEALSAAERTIETAREAVARFDAVATAVTSARRQRAEAAQVLARADARRTELREAASSADREADEHARALTGERDGERAGRARALALEAEIGRALGAASIPCSVDEARLRTLLPLHERAAAIEALDAQQAAAERARAVRDERGRRALAHLRELQALDAAPEQDDLDAWRALEIECARQREAVLVATLRAREEETEASVELARRTEALRADGAAGEQRSRLERALADEERELSVWGELSDVLGSADGKKLRVVAQRRALRVLVREASIHLATLAPRYAVEVVPGTDLSIQVRDRALGGEPRPIGALSGGETFLVSLALALGLRALASTRVHIGTLFIDEGFGSLDPASLDLVLSALDALEATGRQIGIVSHVPEIRDRFAARIEVERGARGTSRVRVVV